MEFLVTLVAGGMVIAILITIWLKVYRVLTFILPFIGVYIMLKYGFKIDVLQHTADIFQWVFKGLAYIAAILYKAFNQLVS